MRAPGPGLVLSALIVDKGVSVGVLFYERYLCARQVTAGTLKIDVATSIRFLDSVSADEPPKWLPRVNRSLGHASMQTAAAASRGPVNWTKVQWQRSFEVYSLSRRDVGSEVCAPDRRKRRRYPWLRQSLYRPSVSAGADLGDDDRRCHVARDAQHRKAGRWPSLDCRHSDLVGLLVVIVLPLYEGVSTIDAHGGDIVEQAEALPNYTLPLPPRWLHEVPLAGERLAREWQLVRGSRRHPCASAAFCSDRGEMAALARGRGRRAGDPPGADRDHRRHSLCAGRGRVPTAWCASRRALPPNAARRQCASVHCRSVRSHSGSAQPWPCRRRSAGSAVHRRRPGRRRADRADPDPLSRADRSGRFR